MDSAMGRLSQMFLRASGNEQEQAARFLINALNTPVRRFIVPMPDGKTPYLERFILSEGDPNGDKVYLHLIYGSDEDRDPHDHPFDFASTIIWGSYREESFGLRCPGKCNGKWSAIDAKNVCTGCWKPAIIDERPKVREFAAGDVNHRFAQELHKLTVLQGPVVTLVRRGPKVREWGFQTPEGWEGHASYIARKFPGAQPTEVD